MLNTHSQEILQIEIGITKENCAIYKRLETFLGQLYRIHVNVSIKNCWFPTCFFFTKSSLVDEKRDTKNIPVFTYFIREQNVKSEE